ncbi:MAG: NUDIX domain-containing protein [Kiritimatiellae bacterium]|nr:NUDIX domain-containing protein [Kiritimatiellia bacterium]
MRDKNMVEVLARGVCVVDGMMLLCYGRQSGVRYLPGGHVEFGECARVALKREMLEETGLEARAGRFLGCCEHAFVQNGVSHAEVNMIFEMGLSGVSVCKEVVASEEWIGFQWQPLERLGEAGMQPAALSELLPKWIKKPGGHCVTGDNWSHAVAERNPSL